MKIEKGYTLSQFIDILNDKGLDANKYAFKYNNFLKQPLKKDMFVNPYPSPEVVTYKMSEKQCKNYFEAEKKAIFEGWRKSSSERFVIINGANEINFSNSDFIEYYHFGTNTSRIIKIIHDLFEATKGGLTLKNVYI